MNVLSLFDGISCGQIALNRAGIKYDNYFASEIDKYAIQVTQRSYPNTIQLGDITKIKGIDLPKIDLVIGGSPCQGFSRAGKELNFNDSRSKLFFDFVRLVKECNPKYFLLENVYMRKEYQSIITDCLKVQSIEINSNLVSAQHRRRLYWTNISGVNQPTNKNILLKDIIDISQPYQNISSNQLVLIKKHNSIYGLKCVGGIIKYKLWLDDKKYLQRNFSQGERIYSINGKSPTLSTNNGGSTGVGNALITDDIKKYRYRKLTPNECEILQTIPDNYTSIISNSQRHKVISNSFTVDIIVHILKHVGGID